MPRALADLRFTTNSSLVGVRFGCPRKLRRTDANKPFCDVDATAIGRLLYAGGNQVSFSDLAWIIAMPTRERFPTSEVEFNDRRSAKMCASA